MEGESVEQPNRILIEFLGGDKDGANLDSRSDNLQEANWARLLYVMAGMGTVGSSFKGYSTAALDTLIREGAAGLVASGAERNHKYTVVERLEAGDEVRVRLRYVGLAV